MGRSASRGDGSPAPRPDPAPIARARTALLRVARSARPLLLPLHHGLRRGGDRLLRGASLGLRLGSLATALRVDSGLGSRLWEVEASRLLLTHPRIGADGGWARNS